MGQLSEFFSGLLDTNLWPARWFCGEWSAFHGWLYIGSDLTIWLAYFIIPVTLVWFIQRRRDLPFPPVFWLFGAFILCCGITHLLDAMIFWWPAYRLSALVRMITAMVSMATVFALIRLVPQVVGVSILFGGEADDLRDRLRERDREVEELRAELQKLQTESA